MSGTGRVGLLIGTEYLDEGLSNVIIEEQARGTPVVKRFSLEGEIGKLREICEHLQKEHGR